MYSCSDTYDLDSDQPTGLNSIYGYLQQQGNYNNYLRLIDDLGQKEILSKTGSKTVFAANDDAFTKFYSTNKWGVKSYEQLSLAQKKLLLNSAMIDNPYSTSMLSTAEGPVKGEVCRRSSSLTIYDSVLVVPSKSALADEILPHNSRFDEIRANHDSIVLFADASNAAPMVHFNYKFITSNRLESSDVDFLYNQPAGTRKNDDVYVNNSKVVNSNIFCKNGFIHEVDNVIMPLDNMAEIIRKDPETTIWRDIIERFALPDYTKSLTDAYNVNKGVKMDSVFNKRYFSDRSAGSDREEDEPLTVDRKGFPFDASLKYDPGWNGYMPLSGDPRDAMMEDMGVMLVPTDSAVNEWFNNGSGKVIKDYYQTIAGTPNSTIDDLIRVNQLASMIASVPSRFEDVLNDANMPLGIKNEYVKEVILGCNGAIYKTNKVFAPTSYSSVLFPAVVDTTNFKIIETAISCLDYDKYLNSMASEYIFLVPTNNGLLTYIDPVSYGQSSSNLWEFHLDPSKEAKRRIYADVYKCTLDEDGNWVKGDKVTTLKNQALETYTSSPSIMQNRLQKLLDNIIVIEPYQPGKKYYRTKANSYVRIDGIENGNSVYGGLQLETGKALKIIKEPYHMENGYALVLDGPILGGRKNVATLLSEHDEFSEFLSIMKLCGALNSTNTKDKWASVTRNTDLGNLFNLKTYGEIGAEDKPTGSSATTKATYLLNNYHYTVYAPTNAAMEIAYSKGLPRVSDVELAEKADEAEEDSTGVNPQNASKMREVMLDFVKYHIQDNSVFFNDKGFNSGAYESAKTELTRSTNTAEAGGYTVNEDGTITVSNVTYVVKSWIDEKKDGTGSVEYYSGKYSPGRPYKINVDVANNSVKDNIGTVHNINVNSDLCNMQAQEYWISSEASTSTKTMQPTDNPYAFYLNNSSSVVVHAIDSPLIYADGEHYDVNGDKVATQFEYVYKKLTTEAKRR